MKSSLFYDFDTATIRGKHYFLVGDQITSCSGVILNPEITIQVLAKCIVKMHRFPYYYV